MGSALKIPRGGPATAARVRWLRRWKRKVHSGSGLNGGLLVFSCHLLTLGLIFGLPAALDLDLLVWQCNNNLLSFREELLPLLLVLFSGVAVVVVVEPTSIARDGRCGSHVVISTTWWPWLVVVIVFSGVRGAALCACGTQLLLKAVAENEERRAATRAARGARHGFEPAA